ncbi:DUF354 domain-containing protein [bacterium]|nr:DUF354 domain-containing protein [bacterium]
MRMLVVTGHPAHIHFFKHFIRYMKGRGHKILICSVDKDVALGLLDTYGLTYNNVGHYHRNLLLKVIDLFRIDLKMYKIAIYFKPGILISLGSPNAAHVAALIHKPHITFEDTEHSREQYYLYAPFTAVICTPYCFKKDLGKKQVRYNGYHELAYLHPNYFKPDPSVLDELGLTEGEKFVIVRFVSWQASHDIGQHGFDLQSKRNLVQELIKYARVLITSESPLPEEFEQYRVNTHPEKIHDLLYYATMYIGEGATMTSESAMLGTPAIYINPLRLGYLDEEESKYNLVYNFHNAQTDHTLVIEKAIELIKQSDLKAQWAKKCKILLADNIDVTRFMVDFIENYPESFHKYMRSNARYKR